LKIVISTRACKISARLNSLPISQSTSSNLQQTKEEEETFLGKKGGRREEGENGKATTHSRGSANKKRQKPRGPVTLVSHWKKQDERLGKSGKREKRGSVTKKSTRKYTIQRVPEKALKGKQERSAERKKWAISHQKKKRTKRTTFQSQLRTSSQKRGGRSCRRRTKAK